MPRADDVGAEENDAADLTAADAPEQRGGGRRPVQRDDEPLADELSHVGVEVASVAETPSRATGLVAAGIPRARQTPHVATRARAGLAPARGDKRERGCAGSDERHDDQGRCDDRERDHAHVQRPAALRTKGPMGEELP